MEVAPYSVGPAPAPGSDENASSTGLWSVSAAMQRERVQGRWHGRTAVEGDAAEGLERPSGGALLQAPEMRRAVIGADRPESEPPALIAGRRVVRGRGDRCSVEGGRAAQGNGAQGNGAQRAAPNGEAEAEQPGGGASLLVTHRVPPPRSAALPARALATLSPGPTPGADRTGFPPSAPTKRGEGGGQGARAASGARWGTGCVRVGGVLRDCSVRRGVRPSKIKPDRRPSDRSVIPKG